MAEGRAPISSSRIATGDIAQHSFAVVRRGFDTDEVRSYLQSVSRSFEALEEREEELRSALAEAEQRAAHPVVDEATLTASLGQHSAQILRHAQEEAAADRRPGPGRGRHVVAGDAAPGGRVADTHRGVVGRAGRRGGAPGGQRGAGGPGGERAHRRRGDRDGGGDDRPRQGRGARPPRPGPRGAPPRAGRPGLTAARAGHPDRAVAGGPGRDGRLGARGARPGGRHPGPPRPDRRGGAGRRAGRGATSSVSVRRRCLTIRTSPTMRPMRCRRRARRRRRRVGARASPAPRPSVDELFARIRAGSGETEQARAGDRAAGPGIPHGGSGGGGRGAERRRRPEPSRAGAAEAEGEGEAEARRPGPTTRSSPGATSCSRRSRPG